MRKYFAYTLAEVIVTMLVIAVIVAVSIKITRTKLDSILSLTYYSAYSSIKSVTTEMVGGFRANEDYMPNETQTSYSYYNLLLSYLKIY